MRSIGSKKVVNGDAYSLIPTFIITKTNSQEDRQNGKNRNLILKNLPPQLTLTRGQGVVKFASFLFEIEELEQHTCKPNPKIWPKGE